MHVTIHLFLILETCEYIIPPYFVLFCQFDTSMYEDAPGTTVSRLLQIPQYVVLTASEVMFSVTGLGFAYSQVTRLLHIRPPTNE